MGILAELRVRNFKCFRSEVRIPLSQGTYIAGENNSGKSAILEALRCFFDDTVYHPDALNRTELAAKKEGFNRTDITLVLDLRVVTGTKRPQRMRSEFGDFLTVRKSLSWRLATNTLSREYLINGTSYIWETLPKDVSDTLSAISVSYIHPQEGTDLLEKAQNKFKERLFHNWGRHASVAEKVNKVEEQWAELRATANSYLSSALSSRLRRIWPNAEVKVDLPENIRDIVAVSDITFRSSPSLPQISLTSHGTGAQSAILYQTHYVLDSDRSLHQGQYYPVWLVEEPESFLHADIALQISRLLSCDEWLGSIQMVIATHSPIILAGSTQNPSLTSWILCDAGTIAGVHRVTDVEDDTISNVGRMMGDGNFGVYFEASCADYRVFLEDSRKDTAKKFAEIGISDIVSLEGASDVDRHLRVLEPLGDAVGQCFFVVDNDAGIKHIKKWIDRGTEQATCSGWRKVACGSSCFLIILPPDHAMEHLFDTWPDVLDAAVRDLYDTEEKRLKGSVPTDLTRAASTLRGTAPNDPVAGREIIANHSDVKDRFWLCSESAKIKPVHVKAVRTLLNL